MVSLFLFHIPQITCDELKRFHSWIEKKKIIHSALVYYKSWIINTVIFSDRI